MNSGLLIILSGPSGVGKGTVREIMFKNNFLNLEYSISMTTRKPRQGETNGVEYYFVTKEEFESAIKNNEFLEHAKFVNNYYGTPKKTIKDKILLGVNVMLEIEVQGAKQIMKNYDGNLLTIFLEPPSLEELKKRICNRGTDSQEAIKNRLNQAINEIEDAKLFQYKFINNEANKTAHDIMKLIESKTK